MSLPLWSIQEIDVVGAGMLSAQEIRGLSGVNMNDNLFFSSFKRTRENLKKISVIKSFDIYRIPPSTVLIKIRERTPIAVVVMKDRPAIVDREGYILNRNPNLTVNIPDLAELPVISGISSFEIKDGIKLRSASAGILSELISELSPIFSLRRVQLGMGNFTNISFLLDDMLKVKVGDGEGIAKKMKVFKALLPQVKGKWDLVEYIDVRYPDNPVIKFH